MSASPDLHSMAGAMGGAVSGVARVSRLARLQEVIAKYPHASDRKKLITMAYEIGAIGADDAKDLIAIYQLETA